MKLLSAFVIPVLFLLGFTDASAQSPLSLATQERVMIDAGDINLGATLYRPAGATGPMPVLVTGHGSSATTRDGVGFYTNLGLRLGFAVLSYDKRGTGESGGAYVPFSVDTSDAVFRTLAADHAAATRWLAGRDDIDPARIGYLGGSQAGWILPLAVTLLDQVDDPDVAFVVIGEGTPLSAAAEDLHDDVLTEVYERNGDLTRLDIARGDASIADTSPGAGYNPDSIWPRYTTPTLWLFGLDDPVIPIQPSIDRLGDLIEAGQLHHDLHILAFGDHNFTNTRTNARYDLAPIIDGWIADRVFAPQTAK